MTFKEIFLTPIKVIYQRSILVACAVALILVTSFYPSDLESDYYAQSKNGQDNAFVVGTENYGRHVNTLLPFGVAVLMRDWAGLKQLLVITVVGIVASHGPKRLLNDVEVMGTRLGQRPNSPTSKHNTPSGHATLAGAGAYFVMRRYSWWFGALVLPVMLATMYARVMLDKHTISATIAGATTGLLVAALFTTKFKDVRTRWLRRWFVK